MPRSATACRSCRSCRSVRVHVSRRKRVSHCLVRCMQVACNVSTCVHAASARVGRDLRKTRCSRSAVTVEKHRRTARAIIASQAIVSQITFVDYCLDAQGRFVWKIDRGAFATRTQWCSTARLCTVLSPHRVSRANGAPLGPDGLNFHRPRGAKETLAKFLIEWLAALLQEV